MPPSLVDINQWLGETQSNLGDTHVYRQEGKGQGRSEEKQDSVKIFGTVLRKQLESFQTMELAIGSIMNDLF